MRICLIATELQGFGAYGGFGALTYDIATGLAARGLDLHIVIPRKEGQRPVERIGNIQILSYPSSLYVGLKEVLPFAAVYRMIDADIYHSEEPSLGTALAQIGCPEKKHLVTFQDPRDLQDWRIEWAHRSLSRFSFIKFWIRYQRETGRAARRANGRYCQARYIIDKSRRMYRLSESPGFLPNPIRMLDICSPKAPDPTVCYIGRWDERKRPEIFLELAVRFPDVKFIAVGACLNDHARDKDLRECCRGLKNVEAPGWLSERDRAAILGRAWVLVNTSSRECLPVTYLEAGAHRCAILSHCNADDFASSFGYWAQKGHVEDFEHGLRFLLENNTWKALGELAYNYVRDTHEYNTVITEHIEAYERILNQ